MSQTECSGAKSIARKRKRRAPEQAKKRLSTIFQAAKHEQQDYLSNTKTDSQTVPKSLIVHSRKRNDSQDDDTQLPKIKLASAKPMEEEVISQSLQTIAPAKENVNSNNQFQEVIEKVKKVKYLKPHSERKPSIRQSFSNLLPNHLSLKIGYCHKVLIDKMCCIDRFLLMVRNNKQQGKQFEYTCSFIKNHMKTTITQNDLRKLIFLDLNLYKIDWVDKNGSYVLWISWYSETDFNETTRKYNLRKNISNYLSQQYRKWLLSQGKELKQELKQWKHGFCPDKIDIPQGFLPLNPKQKDLSLSNLKKEAVEGISNSHFQSIIQKTISISKVSTRSEISRQIFNKKQPDSFKNKLYQIIKAKQAKLQQKKKLAQVKPNFDNAQLIGFCEQSCQLFITRRVESMFLASFSQSMMKRLQTGACQIQRMTNQIIKNQVNFLTLIDHPKSAIIHINRSKYSAIIASYASE